LDFRVLNMVKLQDNRDYYILEDPNGIKHFIDAELYANYGIKSGSNLACKVAKINCTGRILLEPNHPIYIEGQTYFFKLISLKVLNGITNLVIEDIFKNKIEISESKIAASSFEAQNFIRCRIIKLRKGVPELEIAS
jgi:hypothetical protein